MYACWENYPEFISSVTLILTIFPVRVWFQGLLMLLVYVHVRHVTKQFPQKSTEHY